MEPQVKNTERAAEGKQREPVRTEPWQLSRADEHEQRIDSTCDALAPESVKLTARALVLLDQAAEAAAHERQPQRDRQAIEIARYALRASGHPSGQSSDTLGRILSQLRGPGGALHDAEDAVAFAAELARDDQDCAPIYERVAYVRTAWSPDVSELPSDDAIRRAIANYSAPRRGRRKTDDVRMTRTELLADLSKLMGRKPSDARSQVRRAKGARKKRRTKN